MDVAFPLVPRPSRTRPAAGADREQRGSVIWGYMFERLGVTLVAL